MKIGNLFLGLAVVLSGCSLPGSNSLSESAKSAGSSDIGMPLEQNIPALKKKALDGGRAEALQLALWYMKFPKGEHTFEFWTLIAAENGSDVGQYNLATIYASYPKTDYRHERVRFWLAKSAHQNNAAAKRELNNLDR